MVDAPCAEGDMSGQRRMTCLARPLGRPARTAKSLRPSPRRGPSPTPGRNQDAGREGEREGAMGRLRRRVALGGRHGEGASDAGGRATDGARTRAGALRTGPCAPGPAFGAPAPRSARHHHGRDRRAVRRRAHGPGLHVGSGTTPPRQLRPGACEARTPFSAAPPRPRPPRREEESSRTGTSRRLRNHPAPAAAPRRMRGPHPVQHGTTTAATAAARGKAPTAPGRRHRLRGHPPPAATPRRKGRPPSLTSPAGGTPPGSGPPGSPRPPSPPDGPKRSTCAG